MFASINKSVEQHLPAGLQGHGPLILFAIAALVVLSMDFTQLMMVALGAAMYLVMDMPVHQRFASVPVKSKSMRPPSPARSGASQKSAPASCDPSAACAAQVRAAASRKSQEMGQTAREAVSPVDAGAVTLQKDRASTVRPIQPLSFAATCFDAQVQELLTRITPTAQTDKVVSDLANLVKRQLSGLVQDMEVMGFSSSELIRGTAFGVAVPEVDIVACMSLRSVAQCFRGRMQQPPKVSNEADMLKIQKKAVRLFTEHLVRDGRFKFRRSAFRGAEPKVTLLASAELGIHSDPIPFDLTFNSTSPMYNTAFLAEAGKLEPRAKALALLVKRWAKDRALCHAAKGHLSPYAWTLMTIFFLQVGLQEEGPLLPPLSEFGTFCSLSQKPGTTTKRSPTTWVPKLRAAGALVLTVGELFRRFVDFYSQDLNFHTEAVSVLNGRRGPPNAHLPLNIIVQDDGTTCVGPSIEDPFSSKSNLAMGMNEAAWLHLHEEFVRARGMLAAGCSLSDLLEPWGRAGVDDAVGEDADDGINEE